VSDFPKGGIPEPEGIPVELPVEAVKQYVVGEQITPYNFDLLQNYFEGRIIKLLPEQLWALVDGNLQPINVDALIRNATDFTDSTLPISQKEKFYETSCVCCNGEHWG